MRNPSWNFALLSSSKPKTHGTYGELVSEEDAHHEKVEGRGGERGEEIFPEDPLWRDENGVFGVSEKLTLDEAREILKRAVEKSVEVQWISAYAVADEGGNIISISRLDGAPAAAVPLARSKAYLAALTGSTSMPFEHDVETHPVRFHGYQNVLPRPLFGGPGAVPIVRNGKVIGGFSSSLSYSASGMQTTVDGGQFSREELVTAHALQIPYDDQHPDTP